MELAFIDHKLLQLILIIAAETILCLRSSALHAQSPSAADLKACPAASSEATTSPPKSVTDLWTSSKSASDILCKSSSSDPESEFPARTFQDPSLQDTVSGKFIRQLSENPALTAAIRSNAAFIKQLLDDPRLKFAFEGNPKYREVLANGPSLSFLYGQNAGVSEGYSIGEHSTRVLEVFEDQRPHHDLDKIKKPAEVRNLQNVLKHALAFHDIGKSIAVRAGDKSLEEQYSDPLIQILMPASKFNQAETDLAYALVDSHQVIGGYLHGKSLEQTKDKLKDAASKAKMDPKEFFKLATLFFTCDAGSYPTLKSTVFETKSDGKLTPRSEKSFSELSKEF